MILTKHNTIKLIGYPESTITQEAMFFIGKEFPGEILIISPEDFLNNTNTANEAVTYGAAFTLDQDLRNKVINKIESQQLDSIIYVHESMVSYFELTEDEVRKRIGSGTFIAPNSIMLLGSTIGRHCIIEACCLISHYVTIEDNVQLHPGVMIAGRTTIKSNCVFNFKSSVLDALTVCSGVELGAMSCMTKNVDIPGKYVGTPARRIGAVRQFKCGISDESV